MLKQIVKNLTPPGSRLGWIVRKQYHKYLRISERLKTAKQGYHIGKIVDLDINFGHNEVLLNDIAVHVHVSCPELVNEIKSYLENIPVAFNLYVSMDAQEKARFVESTFKTVNNVEAFEVVITEKIGRNVYPMVAVFGEKLQRHNIVLHVHTKNNYQSNLAGWRRHLLENLLGSSKIVCSIIDQFAKNKKLGLLFPVTYNPSSAKFNDNPIINDGLIKILSLAGYRRTALKKINRYYFPAENMFWFRGKVLKPFVKMNLSVQDFEQEEDQLGENLAKSIETLFPFLNKEMGFITNSYYFSDRYSLKYNAHKLHLMTAYIEKKIIDRPLIVFDHNGGGGANQYTSELIKSELCFGHSFLRAYCSEGVWYIQWIANGDGLLFFAETIEDLFDVLRQSKVNDVIVNSLYGCLDVEDTIKNIIALATKMKATLDFKVHDFNALCPSPHLLNDREEYCGVPSELSICNKCLKNNHGWYHSWITEEKKPKDISNWRKPFETLFIVCDHINFFDESSIELFKKVFSLDDNKLVVEPHRTDYFKVEEKLILEGPLHIGIIGVLTIHKGWNFVNELYDYIEKNKLQIPITVVGQSALTHREIKVHGFYEPDELPALISKYGVNAILMPSIIPETFSYTISEAMKMGLPIVSFNLGAQGNRVKNYELGFVVPLNSPPEVILEALLTVYKNSRS